MAAQPYERRKDETDPAWAAFVLYRDAGLDRSLTRVSQDAGKDRSLMEKWSSRHEWRKRVVAYDMEADRRKRIGDLKGVEDMRRRHTRAAIALQDLGLAELTKLAKDAKRMAKVTLLDPALILKLIEQGAKLERLVRGEPGEIVETHTDAVDLSTVSTDDLKALRRVRQQLRAKSEAANTDVENDTVH